MKIASIFGPTAMALGLALAMNAEGSAAEMSSLKLTKNMVIAGVDLRAGTYAVQWKIKGTHATVKFSRDGRAVATVQGECAAFDRAVATNTLYFSKSPDGFFAIHALGFAGSNKGILFPLVRSNPRRPADRPLDNPLENQWWGGNAVAVPRVHN